MVLALSIAAPPLLEARFQPTSGRDAFSREQEIQAGQERIETADRRQDAGAGEQTHLDQIASRDLLLRERLDDAAALVLCLARRLDFLARGVPRKINSTHRTVLLFYRSQEHVTEA
jgi:hypothetical protein